MTDETKALEDFLTETYKVDLKRRPASSYALEFLRTERANAEHVRKLLNLQSAAEGFSRACEYLKSNQQWMDKSLDALNREGK
jgi:hypothetical protein